MPLERYTMTIFFGDDELLCRNKTIKKFIKKMFVANLGSTSHMANSLKI